MIIHEKLEGADLEYDTRLISKEKLLELITPILEIIKRFEDVTIHSIEFVQEDFYNIFIFAGGNSNELGEAAVKISQLISEELEIPNILGDEDYGDLDVLMFYEDFYDYREFVRDEAN